MIKINEVVENIVYSEEEALYSLSQKFMNLSAYAKRIRKEVERQTKKTVKPTSIVVALSRIQKQMRKVHPLIQDIKINNITAKSPLSEIVFEKTPATITKYSQLYEKVKTTSDDFLTITLSTSEITIICSDRIKQSILNHFKEIPIMIETGLASLGISIDPKYYPMPNITYSLIRRIATKKIPLAETITTHAEIIFVFHQENLSEVLNLFQTQ